MELKKGYIQTEVGVIPEDWKIKLLVDLTNIPMVVAFKNGKEVFSKYGNKKEIVEEVLNVLL